MHWDNHYIEVTQGDALTLTCTVTDLRFLDVVRVSRKDASGTELPIADNLKVKPMFLSNIRLKVYFSFNQNGSATSVLQYKEMLGEDAGTFHCYKLGDESNSDILNLTVFVPVDSLKFSTISMDGIESIADNEIFLSEGNLLSVACTAVVNASRTKPLLTISVDSEDISHIFTPIEQTKVIRSGAGPAYFFSEKKLRYETQKPAPRWNDAKLTCTAQQNGYQDVEESVFLRVQYRPVVTCLQADEYAKVGDSVAFSCQVASNPNGTIVWTRNSEKILENDSNTLLTKQLIKPDVSEISLNFMAIDESHFSIYTITAENDYGLYEYNIQLHEFEEQLHQPEEHTASVEETDPNEQIDMKHFVQQSETSGGTDRYSTVILSILLAFSLMHIVLVD